MSGLNTKQLILLPSQEEKGANRTRLGLMLIERGVTRKGKRLWKDVEGIGIITSGTLSPVLKIGIAMGYIPPRHASLGTRVSVEVRER